VANPPAVDVCSPLAFPPVVTVLVKGELLKIGLAAAAVGGPVDGCGVEEEEEALRTDAKGLPANCRRSSEALSEGGAAFHCSFVVKFRLLYRGGLCKSRKRQCGKKGISRLNTWRIVVQTVTCHNHEHHSYPRNCLVGNLCCLKPNIG